MRGAGQEGVTDTAICWALYKTQLIHLAEVKKELNKMFPKAEAKLLISKLNTEFH